ncbi:MAG: hypothetical protein IPP33_04650 [Flavobacteriales bacterium]|nr:hypothetical protein [Flavobacteriales bacterium]
MHFLTGRKALMRLALLALTLYSTPFTRNASAQRPPAQPNAAEILHKMQKLNVLGSVLYIVAHPDDENTRLIAWLANGKKVRTGNLSLTRGDGGQNLIGPGTRRCARHHPHTGVDGGATHRWRGAVLHPRSGLRLQQECGREF